MAPRWEGAAKPTHLRTKGVFLILALVSSPCPRVLGKRGFQASGWRQGGVCAGPSSLLTSEAIRNLPRWPHGTDSGHCQSRELCGEEQSKPQRDLPGGLVVKNLSSNAGDAGSIPGQRTKILHVMGQLGLRALEPLNHN